MYEIYAKEFVAAAQALMELENELPRLTHADLKSGQYKSWLEHLNMLSSACSEMSANFTLTAIKRFISEAESGVSLEQIQYHLKIIRERFNDELDEVSLFVLDQKYEDLYYWTFDYFEFEVAEKFSASVEDDLDEAGRCLAVARPTACVFHLMRAMEAVVLQLGDKLKVTIIDKHNKELPWGIIVSNMAKAVDSMPQSRQRDEWSATCSLLYHVKQAWRNDTMHPKETYTTEQAKEVLDAVFAFLRQLATLV